MDQVRDYLENGPAGSVVRPTPTTTAADPTRTRVMSRAVPPVAPAPPPAEPPPAAGPSRPPAEPRKRRGALLPVLVAVAAVLVVGLLAYAVLSNRDDTTDQTSGQPSGTPDQSSTASSPSPSSSSPSPSPSESASPRPTAAGMESFIEDYLATVTRNPRAAFAMLTPEFQAASGGFRGYRSFWGTIESAEVISVSADPDTLTVSYRVEYTRKDGSTLQDDVSLRLLFEDGRYLIAGES
jgi:hypothetical protein